MKRIAILGLILGVFSVFAFTIPVAAQAEPPHLHVTVDVRPQVINLKSAGTVSAVAFGSAVFDVRNIDLATVGLHAMNRPEQAVAPYRYQFAYVNQDPYLDVIFFFHTRDLILLPTDTQLCLHGNFITPVNGLTHWCGEDAVVIKA